MKTIDWLKFIPAIIIPFLFTGSLSAQQGFVVGQPPWSSTSIQTTGGITYFTHTATVPDCDWISAMPVPSIGTNLTLYAAELQGFLCPECLDCVHTETQVTVLGRLAPGQYRLSCYLPNGPGPSIPFRTMDFAVPTNSGPTLLLSPAGKALTLHLNGVPLLSYQIQASTNLTNWTTITNLSGGSADVTLNTTAQPFRFYRAMMANGTITIH